MVTTLTLHYTVLAPFRDLSKRRSMALLLISFTIYTDTLYAISSVISQLFVAEVRPGTLEYTLYALASTICGVICSVGFLWIRPYIPIRLESWLLIGYGIVILIPVWGCIGFASVNFGYKVSPEKDFVLATSDDRVKVHSFSFCAHANSCSR
jgi:MFS-type transporter involved in bile tolerance (Atg22 family)